MTVSSREDVTYECAAQFSDFNCRIPLPSSAIAISKYAKI